MFENLIRFIHQKLEQLFHYIFAPLLRRKYQSRLKHNSRMAVAAAAAGDHDSDMENSMRELMHYHKAGTEYLNKALSIDENSSKAENKNKIFLNWSIFISFFFLRNKR